MLVEGVSDSARGLNSNKVTTLTDQRAVLLDHEGKSKNTYRVKNYKNEPTEM